MSDKGNSKGSKPAVKKSHNRDTATRDTSRFDFGDKNSSSSGVKVKKLMYDCEST